MCVRKIQEISLKLENIERYRRYRERYRDYYDIILY